jgi:hypothetical protein
MAGKAMITSVVDTCSTHFNGLGCMYLPKQCSICPLTPVWCLLTWQVHSRLYPCTMTTWKVGPNHFCILTVRTHSHTVNITWEAMDTHVIFTPNACAAQCDPMTMPTPNRDLANISQYIYMSYIGQWYIPYPGTLGFSYCWWEMDHLTSNLLVMRQNPISRSSWLTNLILGWYKVYKSNQP